MVLTKSDVEKYIQKVERHLNDGHEKHLKGLTFAELYRKANEPELAKRYALAYISVSGNDYRGHRLLGELLEDSHHNLEALEAYKRCFTLNSVQNDVLLKIVKLYTELDVDPRIAKAWADTASKRIPGHPAIFSLQVHLIKFNKPVNYDKLINLIAEELTHRPRDYTVHELLVDTYIKTNQLEEAFDHCIAVNKTKAFNDNLAWFVFTADVLERYLEWKELQVRDSSPQSRLTALQDVYMNILASYCVLVELNLKEATLRKSSKSLLRLDQLLYQAVNLDSGLSNSTDLGDANEWDVAITEIRAQLYMLSGHLLLRLAKEGYSAWSKSLEMSIACYVTSLRVPEPDTHTTWAALAARREKNPFRWSVMAAARLSQTGHLVLGTLDRYGEEKLESILSNWCSAQGQDDILTTLYGHNNDFSKLFLSEDESFHAPEIIIPEQLIKYDEVFIKDNPLNLQIIVWIGLHWYQHDQHVKPGVGVLASRLFDRLRMDVPDIRQCAANFICLRDVEAFIYAVVKCSAHSVLDDVDVVHEYYQPKLLPICLSSPYCITAQYQWWNAAYSLYNGTVSVSNSGKVKQTVQRGLEQIRALKAHGMHPRLVAYLATNFRQKSLMLKDAAGYTPWHYSEHWKSVEQRSLHYWKVTLALFEDMGRNQNPGIPKDPLFPNNLTRLEDHDVNRYFREACVILGEDAVQRGDLEPALELFNRVETSHAAWNEAQIYKYLAGLESSGAVVDDRVYVTYVQYLKEAKERLIVCLERLEHNKVVREAVEEELAELEALLQEKKSFYRVDPRKSLDFHQLDFDALRSPVSSDITESGEPIPLKENDTRELLATVSEVTLDNGFLREQVSIRDEQVLRLSRQVQELQNQLDQCNAEDIRSTSLSFPFARTPSSSFEECEPLPSSSVGQLVVGDQFTRPGTFLDNGVVPTERYADPAFFSGLSESNTPEKPRAEEEEDLNNTLVLLPHAQEGSDEASGGSEDGADFEPIVWSTLLDASEEHAKPEQFAAKFSTTEAAEQFEMKFRELQHKKPVEKPKMESPLEAYRFGQLQPDGMPQYSSSTPYKSLSAAPMVYIPVTSPASTSSSPMHQHKFTFSTGTFTVSTSPQDQNVAHPEKLSNAGLPEDEPSMKTQFGAQHSSAGFSFNAPTSQPFTFISPSSQHATQAPQLNSFQSLGGKPQTNSKMSTFSFTFPTESQPSAAGNVASQPQRSGLTENKKSDVNKANISDLTTSEGLGSSDGRSDRSPSIFKGRQLFSQPDNEREDVEEDQEIDIKPLVSLPLVKDHKTGEEGETVRFSERGKLYRYASDTKEWKERGTGIIKLLYDPSTGKSRVVMRRDQVHKVCANHVITPTMKLSANATSDRSWVWHTPADISDGETSAEHLAVKFKQKEEASEFKKIFEELQSIAPTSKSNDPDADQDTSSNHQTSSGRSPVGQISHGGKSLSSDDWAKKFQAPEGSWKCDTCSVRNTKEHNCCVACQTPKPEVQENYPSLRQPSFNVPSSSGFKFGYEAPSTSKPAASLTSNITSGFTEFSFASPQWSTGTPGTSQKSPISSVVTNQPSPGFKFPATGKENAAVPPGFVFGQKAGSNGPGSLFGSQSTNEHPKPGQSGLLIGSNGSPRHSEDITSGQNEKGTVLQSMFQPPKGSWKCDTCLVQNPEQAVSCAACQSPKPGTEPECSKQNVPKTSAPPAFSFTTPSLSGFVFGAPKQSTALSKAPNKPSFSFGSNATLSGFTGGEPSEQTSKPTNDFQSMFQPPKGSWKCDTCLVQNPEQAVSCAACQSPNPSAEPSEKNVPKTSAPLAFSFNTSSSSSGFVFGAPKQSTAVSEAPNKPKFSFGSNAASSAGFTRGEPSEQTSKPTNDFQSMFQPPKGSWKCDTCLVQNSEQAVSCAACQSPKPGTESSKQNASPISSRPAFSFTTPSSSSGFTFGSPKQGTESETSTPSKSTFSFGNKEALPTGLMLGFQKSDKESLTSKGSPKKAFPKSGFMFGTPALQGRLTDTSKIDEAKGKKADPVDLSQSQFTLRFDVSDAISASPEKSPVKHETSFDPEAEDVNLVFKPIVSLSIQTDRCTGEENEITKFSNRAKLYRFDEGTWKERGVGEMKILFDPSSKKGRVVMRRDQVHKLCANHYITSHMTLKAHGSSQKCWMWHANGDMADNEVKDELFVVKFNDLEIAEAFKDAFEFCSSNDCDNIKPTEEVASSVSKGDTDGGPIASPERASENTKPAATSPATTGQPSHSPLSAKNDAPIDPVNAHSSNDFKAIFQRPPKGSWKCDTCLVQNSEQAVSCAACQSPNPSAEPSEKNVPKTSNPSAFSFNTSSSSSGFVFGAPKQSTAVSEAPNRPNFSFGNNAASSTGFTRGEPSEQTSKLTNDFQSMFQPPKGSWKCDTCLVQNSEQAVSCAACQSPKPGTESSKQNASPISSRPAFSFTTPSSSSGFTFGSPKQDTESETSTPSKLTFSFGNKDALPTGLMLGFQKSDKESLASKNSPKKASPKSEFMFGTPALQGRPTDTSKMNEAKGKKADAVDLSQSQFTFRFDVSDAISASPEKSPVKHETSFDPEAEDENLVFKPIVSLSIQTDRCTGEENEITKFSNRAKLYRFDEGTWKERGVGEMKILFDPSSKKGRVVMRRDQVHKLCANHYITSHMTLQAHGSSQKCWMWHANGDMADNEVKDELFVVKFKDLEIAGAFKDAFEFCSSDDCDNIKPTEEVASSVSKEDTDGGPIATPERASDFWECETCLVKNLRQSAKCSNCQATKPAATSPATTSQPYHSPLSAKNDAPIDPVNAHSSNDFKAVFQRPPKGSWKCDTCLVQNPEQAVSCAACQSPNPSAEPSEKNVPKTSDPPAFSFNTSSSSSGFVFGAPKQSTAVSEAPNRPNFSFGSNAASSAGFTRGEPSEQTSKPTNDFQSMFQPPKGSWKCDTCLVQNSEQAVSCAACQSPKPGTESSKQNASPISSRPAFSFTTPSSSSGFTFGSPKQGTESETSTPSKPTFSFGNKDALPTGLMLGFQKSDKESLTSKNSPKKASPKSEFMFGTPALQGRPTDTSKIDEAKGKKVDAVDLSQSQFTFRFDVSDAISASPEKSPVKHETSFDPEAEDENLVFKPIVSLSIQNDRCTGEENEITKFSNRAKLYRFDEGTWKERGVGEMKILFDPSSKKGRVVMRRDQVHKLCANHYITSHMTLKAHGSSQKCWMWHANGDMADNEVKDELFVVKFKNLEIAEAFKDAFEFCSTNECGNHGDDDVEVVRETPGTDEQQKQARRSLPPNFDQYSDQADGATKTNTSVSKDEIYDSSAIPSSYGEPSGKTQTFTFGSSDTTSLSFGDLASNSKTSFTKSPQGKGFAGAGAQLFRAGQSAANEADDPERECSDINFQPVVDLPEQVERTTGEENEDIVYCERAKLYRFDQDVGQWKERGVGNLKLLKHKTSGQVRVLMRREQVLKLCANHFLTADMELKPNSDRSWVWFTNADISDGEAKQEKLAAKFRNAELAKQFKEKFDLCQNELDSTAAVEGMKKAELFQDKEIREQRESPLKSERKFVECREKLREKSESEVSEVENATSSGESKYVDDDDDDDVVITFERIPTKEQEERAKKYQLPRTFYCFDGWDDDSGDNSGEETYQESFGAVNRAEETPVSQSFSSYVFGSPRVSSLSFETLANTVNKSGFGFGESPQREGFTGAGAQLFGKEPAETDDGEYNPEVEVVGAHFQPAVHLPEQVERTTGEENEDIVYCERAKLYRFDQDVSQWKERGVGNLKLLKHKTSGQVRVLMRREQVLKLCANHFLTADMELKPNSDRSWVWYTNADISDGEATQEKLAAKFRNAELAKQFKEKFDLCQSELGIAAAVEGMMKAELVQDKEIRAQHESTQKSEPKFVECQEKLREQSKSEVSEVESATSSDESKYDDDDDDDVVITFERIPTKEQEERAKKYQLPRTFYCFDGWDDDSDDNSGEETYQERFGAVNRAEETPVSQSFSSYVFGSPRVSSLSFETLANTVNKSGFGFGESPQREGFTGAGAQLFGKESTETDDGEYNPEVEVVGAHFQPAVHLPEQVERTTGEENEDIVYCERAKLYRFDQDVGQWKERGVGNLKLLKHKTNGQVRVLMRREQVLKLCANHFLTADMELKPNSDRSWVWYTNADISDGEAKQEKLAAKFRNSELAKQFKEKFDMCKEEMFSTEQDGSSVDDIDGTSPLHESFAQPDDTEQPNITEQPSTPEQPTSIEQASNTREQPGTTNEPTTTEQPRTPEQSTTSSKEPTTIDHASITEEQDVTKPTFMFGSQETSSLSFASLAAQSSSFHKGDGFAGAGKTVFGQILDNQDEEYDPEKESDGIHFKPIVCLPSHVDLHTGEEGESVVYSHRAKLYRYDGETKQWKERGVGVLKILANDEFNRFRIVMRREKVHKLCANHFITTDMELKENSDRSWLWFVAADFAEECAKSELLAARFRNSAEAVVFRDVFIECQEKLREQSESEVSEVENATSSCESKDDDDDDDVVIMFERIPTKEQEERAKKYQLPETFYCEDVDGDVTCQQITNDGKSESVDGSGKEMLEQADVYLPDITRSTTTIDPDNIRGPSTTEHPTSTTEPPTSTTEPPTSTPEPPTSTTEPPTSTTEPPTSTTEPPTSTIEYPASTTEPLTSTTEYPTSTTEPPTSTTEPPTSTTEPPTSTAELPASTTEPPARTTEPPTSTTELPTSTTEPPTSTTEPPTSTTEPPTSTTEPPTSTTEPPASTTEPPTSTTEPPASTTEPPARTTEPPTSTTEPQTSTTNKFVECQDKIRASASSATDVEQKNGADEEDVVITYENLSFPEQKQRAQRQALPENFFAEQTTEPGSRKSESVDGSGKEMLEQADVYLPDITRSTTTIDPDNIRGPSSGEPPTSSTEHPTNTTEPPTSTTEPPTSTTEPPTSTTEPPTSTTEPPTSTTEPPASTTEPPTSTTEPPTSTTEPPTSTTEPPTSTTEPPTSTAEPPASTTEPPTSTTEPPTSTTEPPTSTTEPPTSTTEPPTSTTEPPTSTTEPPTSTAEPPASTTEPPTSTTEPPTSTTEPPTSTTEPPTSTTEPPTSTTEPPTSTTEPPTSTTEPPTSTAEPPASITEPPARTTEPPTSTTEPPTSTTNKFVECQDKIRASASSATDVEQKNGADEEDVVITYENLSSPEQKQRAQRQALPESFFAEQTTEPGSRKSSSHSPLRSPDVLVSSSNSSSPLFEASGISPKTSLESPKTSRCGPGSAPSQLSAEEHQEQGELEKELSDASLLEVQDKSISYEERQLTSSSMSQSFVFGSPTIASVSFASLAESIGSSSSLTKSHDQKGLPSAGAQLFSEGKIQDEEAGQFHPEVETTGVHFQPVVHLPEQMERTTGEENEDIVYCERAKLYRFDQDVGQWKERGVGNLKLLKHKTSGQVRVLMRREQVLKLCANHFLTADMELKPNSDRSWVWYTNADISDGEAKQEKLAAKFRNAELAKQFKEKFDMCKEEMSSTDKIVDEENHEESKEISSSAEGKSESVPVKVSSEVSPSKDSKPPTFASTVSISLKRPEKPGVVSPRKVTSTMTASQEYNKQPTSGKVTVNSTKYYTVTSERKVVTNVQTFQAASTVQKDVSNTQVVPAEFADYMLRSVAKDMKAGSRYQLSASSLFSNKAKLFRFDEEQDCWVEKGSGVLHIIDQENNRFHIFMVNNTDSIICVAHEITPVMDLKPNAGSDRSWVWFTLADHSSDPVSADKLAAEFTSVEASLEFKKKFDECRDLCGVPHEGHVREMAASFNSNVHELPTMINTQKKIIEGTGYPFWQPCPDCGVENNMENGLCSICGTDLDKWTTEGQQSVIVRSSQRVVNVQTTADSAGIRSIRQEVKRFDPKDQLPRNVKDRSEVRWWKCVECDVENSDSNDVCGICSLSKPDGTKSSSDVYLLERETSEDDRKPSTTTKTTSTTRSTETFGCYLREPMTFSDVVSLPKFQIATSGAEFPGTGSEVFGETSDDDIATSAIDVLAGEQSEKNDESLFRQHVKLFRFDLSIGEWKEKGNGTLKILRNITSHRARVVMHRDKVLSLCANHYISATMELHPPDDTDKVWIWTAQDYSSGEMIVQYFAVVFKTNALAADFKKVFDECCDFERTITTLVQDDELQMFEGMPTCSPDVSRLLSEMMKK